MSLISILGVIPARGGSKGLPGKNLMQLGSTSLVGHACASALASGRLASVVISTDDPAIAEEAARHGVGMHGLRPAELSADDTSMLDVLRYELQEARKKNSSIDAVMVLQPTSPFRTAAHINEAIAIMEKTGADTVVSVVEVPHRFVPTSLMEEHDGKLTFVSPASPLRRQEKQKMYARNGPVVLVTKTSVLDKGALYGDFIAPFLMDQWHSFDIDTHEDLRFAEALLAAQGL